MRDSWKPKPADRVVRHPRQDEIQPVRVTVTTRRVPSRLAASPLMILCLFAGLILIGTLLLLPPFTHHGGGITPFMTALFTATSAITVTGLAVEDTATYWTFTGQIIILAMIYIGGLGFMTVATFMLILIGQRVSLAQRLLIRESLLVNQLGGLARLTTGIVVVATIIQFLGFLGLFARFYFLYPPAEAVWQAAFLSISAFNSAGFDILNEPEGIGAFRGDEAVLSILAILIFIGAISYLVIIDIARVRRFSRLTLNTKVVLVTTAILTLIGVIAFFGMEYRNPDTLGPLPVHEKLIGSIFQSISIRTAGLSIVDVELVREHTNVLSTGLMFIGGASASVAGGIKVNTLAVVVVAIVSTIRGRNHASAFGREIPLSQVQRAMVIGAISTAFVFLVIFFLSISEDELKFIDLLFEGASAFGTAGLSTGITSSLSTIGQLILMVTMFIGRLGPLTIGLTMAQRAERDLYRYPQERVTIG